MAIGRPGLLIEPPHGGKLLRMAELCVFDRRFQHLNGLIIDAERHRKGMPVLAAVSKGEARWIGEAVWRAVENLGDHRQRAHCPRSDAGNKEQLGEIRGAALRRRDESCMETRRQHIAGSYVMMGRHDQMRQKQLS